VIHHTFFGIEVDQWISARAEDGDASIFFRADRVIARSVSRDVPADLFRVNLPTPPQAGSEGSMREPRVGMTERNIRDSTAHPDFALTTSATENRPLAKSTRAEATRRSSPSPSSMVC